MEQPKIYLETSICSYLAGWPSRDLITASRQQITHEWWKEQREQFVLFASEYVWMEASRGDNDAAQRRLSYLSGVTLLSRSEEAVALAERLQDEVPLPARAAVDALHIAIAAANGMDYLLTWNCTHIANATLRVPIGDVCRSHGFEPPVICTPEELLGKDFHDQ